MLSADKCSELLRVHYLVQFNINVIVFRLELDFLSAVVSMKARIC